MDEEKKKTSLPQGTFDKQAYARGRPSIYSDELADRICEMVARRVSVWRICAMDDMPSEDTLYRWKRTNADFSEKYARAREARADARQDRIDFIAEQCGEGMLDPTIARVMIDAERWQASKEQPKSYGDKVIADVNHGIQDNLRDLLSTLDGKTRGIPTAE
jgi:hypothetical protein